MFNLKVIQENIFQDKYLKYSLIFIKLGLRIEGGKGERGMREKRKRKGL